MRCLVWRDYVCSVRQSSGCTQDVWVGVGAIVRGSVLGGSVANTTSTILWRCFVVGASACVAGSAVAVMVRLRGGPPPGLDLVAIPGLIGFVSVMTFLVVALLRGRRGTSTRGSSGERIPNSNKAGTVAATKNGDEVL